MSNRRYWIVTNRKIRDTITKHFDEWKKIRDDALALCGEIGAETFYTSTSLGRLFVSGFHFDPDTTPDPKTFVRLKKVSGGWRPRVKSALFKRVDKLQSDLLLHTMNAIGMKMFRGAVVCSPGITVNGKAVYLSLPDDVEPKGCRRVSDIEYEKAGEQKRKRKKASVEQ